MTPRMSAHARLRCVQMGVTTKRAKHVVQRADVVYPGGTNHVHPHGAWIALSDCDPEIAVVYADDPDGPVILTVLFRGIEYSR